MHKGWMSSTLSGSDDGRPTSSQDNSLLRMRRARAHRGEPARLELAARMMLESSSASPPGTPPEDKRSQPTRQAEEVRPTSPEEEAMLQVRRVRAFRGHRAADDFAAKLLAQIDGPWVVHRSLHQDGDDHSQTGESQSRRLSAASLGGA
mmetsp:Transcript_70487/g.168815  ORF Transcript_70487/g.168815 Transcript_70487/m.168815 type:complete len:149 (-) Transcript_70487:205-651(-)|eukprot:CAMPEP_0178402668 /NCGR_PEP_ID=MMETSP0689_2-20121128/16965_1 /TAXON_ID=160604 /ORGANISM="Amphidinium massartii, Strain CS-259" /LENGTH=148 /DNA_ID=CAMNT_0020023585 /DNA_START=96 /DNA_END=542 /DNA_ORIENTATION=+